MNTLLKLWHPYIPFVTEEIYARLGFSWDLIDATWWKVTLPRNENLEKDNALVFDVIREIRAIRADNNILPNKTIGLKIYAKQKNKEILSEVLELIAWIVKADSFELVEKKPDGDNYAFWVIKAWVEVFVDTSNALDVDKEIERIKLQIDDTKEYISILDKKLLNETFISKAPEKLVRAEMEKKEQALDKLRKLEEKINKLVK